MDNNATAWILHTLVPGTTKLVHPASLGFYYSAMPECILKLVEVYSIYVHRARAEGMDGKDGKDGHLAIYGCCLILLLAN